MSLFQNFSKEEGEVNNRCYAQGRQNKFRAGVAYIFSRAYFFHVVTKTALCEFLNFENLSIESKVVLLFSKNNTFHNKNDNIFLKNDNF